jgi:hypothetical protein
MQTLTVAAVTPTRRQLQMEATELLRDNGLSAFGRPLDEARAAREEDAIGNDTFKWKPPKRQ